MFIGKKVDNKISHIILEYISRMLPDADTVMAIARAQIFPLDPGTDYLAITNKRIFVVRCAKDTVCLKEIAGLNIKEARATHPSGFKTNKWPGQLGVDKIEIVFPDAKVAKLGVFKNESDKLLDIIQSIEKTAKPVLIGKCLRCGSDQLAATQKSVVSGLQSFDTLMLEIAGRRTTGLQHDKMIPMRQCLACGYLFE